MMWPYPLRDETLYSWLARTARLNAVSNDMAFCDWLTGTQSTSIMDAPFNLLMLSKKSSGSLGSASQILHQMTAFHVAGALGDVLASDLMEMAAGTRRFDLMAEALGGMCRWRFCTECRMDDIAEAGLAWWHREHQLPTSLVCAIHGIALHWLDVKRHRIHERFILPTDGDVGSTLSLASVTSEDPLLWKALAALGREALDGRGELPSRSAIRDALVAGLHQQGLITPGANLRRDEYLAKYVQRIGRISAPGLLKRVDSVVEPLSLMHGIWPGRYGGQPLLRLILVHWLYGSWRSYLGRCNWEAVLGVDRRTAPETLNAIPVVLLEESPKSHRDVCLAFLAKQAGASRSAFWRSHPGSLRWLSRYDADWLNFHFPASIQRVVQRQLFE